ncbi:ATP-binding protein [Marinobacter similis]|uniref:HAMP domain-containing histidine kinase n=1 Tax=Marinobacter similis TaxID=1420916 RepID=UPI000AC3500F|nr:HAMP domain-containing histidine kinase [Marinobacter similis]
MLSALRGTVEGIEKALTQVEEQMEDRREALRLASTTPVNLVRLVEDALLRNQSPLNEKRIDLASDWPYAPSLVWADAEVLSRVLDRVLVLLLKDATPDGRLFITLSEHLEPRQQARLVLSNEGYGLPQQTLDRIWNQSVADLVDSDDPLEETMGMLKSLESWGGRAQVSTRVGKGFRLEMDFSTLGFRDEHILSERGHDPVGNQMQSGHDNDNS